MPEKTPDTPSESGYIPEDTIEVRLGAGATNQGAVRAHGLRHRVFPFLERNLDNTDTWTSGIPGLVAVAWQGAGITDSNVPYVTDRSTGEITFAGGTNATGWLHVWSRG